MTTATAAARRVRVAKYGGDDRYSWALFIDGRATYTGMDRTEAAWRRRGAIANLAAGRPWNRDAEEAA